MASSKPSVASGVVQAAVVPTWLQACLPIILIFGGCCSNVFALEAIIKAEPQSGHLITIAQFIVVALEGFYYHFDPKSPTLLKKNTIPIRRWIGQIILFFSVSLLNNAAFGYNISVPVHIILRSGGSVCTMVVGYLFGKRFTRYQVYSVILLTAGVIISALADSQGKESKTEQSTSRFVQGLAILFIAQVLSAFMGLYVEQTYKTYGANWREGLFYTHFLALPLFLPFYKDISTNYHKFVNSPRLPLHLPAALPLAIRAPPRDMLFLVTNIATQYVCVRGVNLLGSTVTALTITIVLNIRKLASLLLSIWLFGNKLSPGVLLGATIVFSAGGLYGWETSRAKRMQQQQQQMDKADGEKESKKDL